MNVKIQLWGKTNETARAVKAGGQWHVIGVADADLAEVVADFLYHHCEGRRMTSGVLSIARDDGWEDTEIGVWEE